MNKLLKTLLAPVLAIILVTVISLNVFADTYNRDAAIAYAKAHWDREKEGELDPSHNVQSSFVTVYTTAEFVFPTVQM